MEKRILVVEDNMLVQEVYASALQQLDCDVVTADDGQDAPLAGDGMVEKSIVRTTFHRTGDQPDSWAAATEKSG